MEHRAPCKLYPWAFGGGLWEPELGGRLMDPAGKAPPSPLCEAGLHHASVGPPVPTSGFGAEKPLVPSAGHPHSMCEQLWWQLHDLSRKHLPDTATARGYPNASRIIGIPLSLWCLSC